MRRAIEDYALISDLHTGALVSTRGSIDFLCLPQFDSDAAFCALLGDEENGCWSLAPVHAVVSTQHEYREDSLVLETTMRTQTGSVKIIDFMPQRRDGPTVVRIVRGLAGTVTMHTRIVCRFAYGSMPPWIHRTGDHVAFTIGPDAIALRSDVELEIDENNVNATFDVREGSSVGFIFQWHDAPLEAPPKRDANDLLRETDEYWRDWAGRCTYDGPYRAQVRRSLITLKALIYQPSGGSVAALTTSLPERLGAGDNWDYRFSWIRDSAFTVDALVNGGYDDEARAWRDWLLRVLAGEPQRLQIMYSIDGNRRLKEYEADWLRGYEGSKPVHIGNEAYEQFQLGIYGHLMQAIFTAHDQANIPIDEQAWARLTLLLDHVCDVWRDPDSGIWEYRESVRHYTISRVMAWVALQFGVQAIEREGYAGTLERWRSVRDEIAAEVRAHAFNERRNAFTQFYGSNDLDASLLLMPLVNFIDIADPQWQGTLRAIEDELCIDGFVIRDSRHIESHRGGPQPTEGAFLACNMWLVENYAMAGRKDEAKALFERVLNIANDVGLLAEEYDVRFRRQVGNFPQTFSHATLVNAAVRLSKV
jgi:GH15 family glucan-1,4-alpha-glucosidase